MHIYDIDLPPNFVLVGLNFEVLETENEENRIILVAQAESFNFDKGTLALNKSICVGGFSR